MKKENKTKYQRLNELFESSNGLRHSKDSRLNTDWQMRYYLNAK